MGRRSNFEHKPRNAYFTPAEAVTPLLAHLIPGSTFIEPCAGDGRLIRHLEAAGHKCTFACDIEPLAEGIERRDVLCFDFRPPPCEQIITNPPWERSVLHAMIEKFSKYAPCWLLYDAAWAYTKQAKPYLKFCYKIIPVGRVKWIEETKMSGKEDVAWYYFMEDPNPGFSEFINP